MNDPFRKNADRLIERALRLRADKVRKRQRLGAQLENELLPLFSYVVFYSEEPWPEWMDSILHGVANLNWYRDSSFDNHGVSGTTGDYRQVPLSKSSLRKIFTTLPLISTEEIRKLLIIDDRQSRRYFKACQIAYP